MIVTLFPIYKLLALPSGGLCVPINDWLPPIDNKTALRTEFAPSWVPEPRGRGTWDLLYSCTFTLVLCVYTAIHLNIPPNEGRWRYYQRKIKWVVIALIAPEIVLFSAWFQWYQARAVQVELNNLLETPKGGAGATLSEPGQTKESSTRRLSLDIASLEASDKVEATESSSNEAPIYSLIDGYFIVMGGFIVDTEGFSDQNLPKRMTLTAKGVIHLAKNKAFRKFHTPTILDKSKADVLAKGLVCFQVLWLVVQAIARKLTGYPLTLLEVHTLVHVVCALMMYTLWFRKPVDIYHPESVDLKATNIIKEEYKRSTRSRDMLLQLRARNLNGLGSEKVETGERKTLNFSGGIAWELSELMVAGILGGLLLLCAAYGGVHMAAWNFQFPSKAEHLLWKVSCITTVVGGTAPPAWLFLASHCDENDDAPLSKNLVKGLRDMIKCSFDEAEGCSRIIFLFIHSLALLSIVLTPLFLSARIAVVVESFISLRRVPAGAYASIPWAESIPHF